MFKKIISLVCIFSCTTIFSAHSEALSTGEIKIYNAIRQRLWVYSTAWKHDTIDAMENLLKETGTSSQELYNILNKRLQSINQEITYLYSYLQSLENPKIMNFIGRYTRELFKPRFSSTPGIELFKPMFSSIPAEAGGMYLLFAISPVIIGMPMYTAGTTMKAFMTPSPAKNIISSSLVGIGGLLSIPATILALAFGITVVEDKVKSILYQKNAKQRQLTEIWEEKENILYIIAQLKKFYPDLVK